MTGGHCVQTFSVLRQLSPLGNVAKKSLSIGLVTLPAESRNVRSILFPDPIGLNVRTPQTQHIGPRRYHFGCQRHVHVRLRNM